MILARPILFCMLLAVPAASAFDPRATDILTIRLGMPEAEVTGKLSDQGFVGSTFRREHRPCRKNPAAHCLTTITTRTKDGRLTVEFDRAHDTGPDRVVAIAYALDAKRPGEPEAITISVQERYGPPDIAHPMTWCDRPGGIGPCSSRHARLVLHADGGAPLVLRLTDADHSGGGH